MNDEQQPPLYQILDWNQHFENNRSRQVTKCQYVCVPNQHGGVGIRNVLAEPDGAAIYGIWVLLLQLLSRQSKRDGWLTQDGKQNGRRFSATELARLWGIKPVNIFRMLQITTREDVDWVRLVDGEHEWRRQAAQREAVESENELEEQGPDVTPTSPGRQSDVSPTSVGDVQVTSKCEILQPAVNESFNGDVQVTSNRRPSDVQLTKKEGKKEGTYSITSHNATVMEGRLVNTLKVEEEMPWIDDLFETHEPWSCEELQLLSELLPIRPQAKKLLIWAYRQVPRSNPFHERTRLKQARLFLLREFSAEVQKIMSVRRELGLPAEIPEGKT